MPVNLVVPIAESLHPIAGIKLGAAAAGIRNNGRDDVLVAIIEPGATAAGVFTRNRFCAAPVTLSREHLARNAAGMRAIVVNAGNANAGTGASGMAAARRSCEVLAELLGCEARAVIPMSTGVILEPLPIDKLTAALPAAIAAASEDNWLTAARTIMTTDTLPKAVSRQVDVQGKTVSITGIVKGAGMIRPDMGTMLSLIATDAAVPADLLLQWLRDAVDQSYNRITVDGDTSTNDTVIAIATGRSGVTADAGMSALRDALFAVTRELAQAVIRDGEGATKFVTINVEEAGTRAEASAVAYAIAHSPLVKTAFFASDPNLGRLLCAIGYAGIADLDVSKVTLLLDDVLVAREGGRDPDYREEQGKRVLSQAEFSVTVRLARGAVATTVWTCDLSHDYVSINADYRS